MLSLIARKGLSVISLNSVGAFHCNRKTDKAGTCWISGNPSSVVCIPDKPVLGKGSTYSIIWFSYFDTVRVNVRLPLFLQSYRNSRMTSDARACIVYCFVYAFMSCCDSTILPFVKIYTNTPFAAVFPIFTQRH